MEKIANSTQSAPEPKKRGRPAKTAPVTQEIAPRAMEVANVPPSSVEGFISQAIALNAPVETLERLFDLQNKVKAERAKSAFIEALGTFQSEVPIIEKTKKVMNKDGRTVRYQYAPLDAIVAQIRKSLSANGFSYSWDTVHENGHMRVTAKLQHKLGHFEQSTLEIPIVEGEGFMTSPQKYASAQTYAKRYTLLNVLGIGTTDEDDDATSVKKEPDAKNAGARIIFRLRALGEKTATREETDEAVRRLTQLDPTKENAEEIAARLQVLIDEKNGV